VPSNGRSAIYNRTPATVASLTKLLLASESAKHNFVQFSIVNLPRYLVATAWRLHPPMCAHPILTTSSPFPLIISFHTLMIYSLSPGVDSRKANARPSFQIHILTSSLFDECTFSALGPTLVGFRSRKSFVDGTLEPPKNDPFERALTEVKPLWVIHIRSALTCLALGTSSPSPTQVPRRQRRTTLQHSCFFWHLTKSQPRHNQKGP
jgi:hypothetical protein